MSEGYPVWARDSAEGRPATGVPTATPVPAPAREPAVAAADPAQDRAGEPPAAGPAGPAAPAEPQPLGVTVAMTGNAEVDAAVERLGDADELPVHAHIEVYEDVHRGLRDALTALDENRG
ncbi:hypothetical protein [Streptomyces sp. NPDC020917]|uniref:hypothetical protein n=1 Tax=Streptomyces sp. NPDC020917 TaxID=3365102 RepID=UPI0037AC5F8C